MPVRSLTMALAGLSICVVPQAHTPPSTSLASITPPPSFEQLAAECAPGVHPTTLKAVVSTESAWNPYAIGVVGAQLKRQPRNLAEAIATVQALERQGLNFSLGLGQVNKHHLPTYGETYDTVFEPCRNLKAGAAILTDCYQRAKKQLSDEQSALRAAFSCYYSGNFRRGFLPDKAGQPSYVQKVVGHAASQAPPIPVVPAILPQSVDAAIATRPASRPGTPSKPAAAAAAVAAPTPWVVFAVSAQPGPSSTPSDDPPPPAATDQAPKPSNVKTQAVQRAAPNSHQQDAPFVQFVD